MLLEDAVTAGVDVWCQGKTNCERRSQKQNLRHVIGRHVSNGYPFGGKLRRSEKVNVKF